MQPGAELPQESGPMQERIHTIDVFKVEITKHLCEVFWREFFDKGRKELCRVSAKAFPRHLPLQIMSIPMAVRNSIKNTYRRRGPEFGPHEEFIYCPTATATIGQFLQTLFLELAHRSDQRSLTTFSVEPHRTDVQSVMGLRGLRGM
jgi:hypothetical protein